MNRILNIKEGLNEDESIVAYELYQFYPEVGTQYNNPGNLTISVQNSDNFYHPARSWLEFEGQVAKKDPFHKENRESETVSQKQILFSKEKNPTRVKDSVALQNENAV